MLANQNTRRRPAVNINQWRAPGAGLPVHPNYKRQVLFFKFTLYDYFNVKKVSVCIVIPHFICKNVTSHILFRFSDGKLQIQNVSSTLNLQTSSQISQNPPKLNFCVTAVYCIKETLVWCMNNVTRIHGGTFAWHLTRESAHTVAIWKQHSRALSYK